MHELHDMDVKMAEIQEEPDQDIPGYDDDALWDLHDPTSMNVEKQLKGLLNSLPQNAKYVEQLRMSISSMHVLEALSIYLRHPSLTLAISDAFRPLLIDLSARWIDQRKEPQSDLDALETLALLIEVQEELYSVLNTFVQRYQGGPLAELLRCFEVECLDDTDLQRVLLAYYRILHATPSIPRLNCWSLTSLISVMNDARSSRGSKLLAIQCYSLQSEMAEWRRLEVEEEYVGRLGIDDCSVYYGLDPAGAVVCADGWLLSVLEAERITHYRTRLLSALDYYDGEETSLTDADLCPHVVNVHGILMLRSGRDASTSSPLVATSSAIRTLRQVAVELSLRRPVLLTSVPSAGKTTIIGHLSSLLHPASSSQIITVHLADTSLDPRSLLGSYVSSTTNPGSFEWKDGVLVKAMREGKWLLLKDIDRASSEILSIISPLCESLDGVRPIGSRARINVPSHGEVEAAERFALFATRSVEHREGRTFPSPSFLGFQKWAEIQVKENTQDDLRLIIASKFKSLHPLVSDALTDMWQSARDLRVHASTRPIGIRDLEKLCARVVRVLGPCWTIPNWATDSRRNNSSLPDLIPHPSIREDIFIEAHDIFFAAGATSKSSMAQRDAIARMIGTKLGLTDQTCDWLTTNRTPVFEIERDMDGRPTSIRAGRSVLTVNNNASLSDASLPRSYSMHRQARRLVAQVSACLESNEPILLTGETGTGKTSVVSYLASLLNKKLVALNMSNQTESSDLIGGFRPISARVPALRLQQRFLELFERTFSSKKNSNLLHALRRSLSEFRWKAAVKLWNETASSAIARVEAKAGQGSLPPVEGERRKRRKVAVVHQSDWEGFKEDVRLFEVRHIVDKGKFSFEFVDGPLVEALQSGHWVLLDEINLASAETLECISGIIQGPQSSITLTEKGSLEAVLRHSEFRLIACMNPATDVGKKELPNNIRARFTEIEVLSPDDDKDTLVDLIAHYVGYLALTDKAVVFDIYEFYSTVKAMAKAGKLADGTNHSPHFSMRSLTRALSFATGSVQAFGLRRALWEGFVMSFTMVLDQASADEVLSLARRTLLSTVQNANHFLSVVPPAPAGIAGTQIGPFWLSSGPLNSYETPGFILTPSVQRKVVNIARIVSATKYPVLIEGPTSSGKTSSIEYLANLTGHKFIRINNHEHTDIQEYIGSYVSDADTGTLAFRDGLLVQALRTGCWIVLDELNLAPTDVLEALNRLLDDNRELVIPETQEVVRPHPDFMLFATQNPSGTYSGRKALSRAFRSRFMEVHFQDVPSTELEYILSQRSRIPPSYSQKMVTVFHELQKRRQLSRIFDGKEGFATLRDLFRWAGRDASSYQDLANNGYMVIAERARNAADKKVVKDVLESILKVSIDERALYDIIKPPTSSSVVWTEPMRRLFVLLSEALKYNEPVLLVGDTGTGKTTVCQIYAELTKQQLRMVNCHQNTEASDIIGSLRPSRRLHSELADGDLQEVFNILKSRGFNVETREQLSTCIKTMDIRTLSPEEEHILSNAKMHLDTNQHLLQWQDGPLVQSMRSGGMFLLDEISLADDSVLERLNSVLESTRTLVLAERGGAATEEYQVPCDPAFKFVATMNPGGDFGKKELSPALRNRFTEVWVPSMMSNEHVSAVITHSWKHKSLEQLSLPLLNFVEWFFKETSDHSTLTLRDILAWIEFCNNYSGDATLRAGDYFIHGGQSTVIDGLSSLPQLSSWSDASIRSLRDKANEKIFELVCDIADPPSTESALSVSRTTSQLNIGCFSLPLGREIAEAGLFHFEAPTTLTNAFRLVRACQIEKPILLEGSPGVGKTSLVTALAQSANQKLCRINLSEQTDLVDLFGSDLPSSGEDGLFAWSDAEFLRALKYGHWVLLDEMNLAPQSVLEGLNAVFDHRGTVYVPELDRSFPRHPNFRVFACQNPLSQGSGRKGLPKSFLNRFTRIQVEQLLDVDMLLICKHLYPSIPERTLNLMIKFNSSLHYEVVEKKSWGLAGSPWEFNLRDILRWASLITSGPATDEPWRHLGTVYLSRFRNERDKAATMALFKSVFVDDDIEKKVCIGSLIVPDRSQFGNSKVVKGSYSGHSLFTRALPPQHQQFEAALASINKNWLVIVTGDRSTGKSTFVHCLSDMCGRPLQKVSLSTASDISELIGSYEQTSHTYHSQRSFEAVRHAMDENARHLSLGNAPSVANALRLLESAKSFDNMEDANRTGRTAYEILEALPDFDGKQAKQQAIVRLLDVNRGDPSALQPRFEWIDGPLTEAMRHGGWLVLDGANLCSPSVLDRLNSVCESDGVLVLNEKGEGQEIIHSHPRFRLIMIVDPRNGEISRAMRNRGIEIALPAFDEVSNNRRLTAVRRLPDTVPCRVKPSAFALFRQAVTSLHIVASRSDSLTPSPSLLVSDNESISLHTSRIREIISEAIELGPAGIYTVLQYCSPEAFLLIRRFLLASRVACEDVVTKSFSELASLRENMKAMSLLASTPQKLNPLHPFLAIPHRLWLSDSDLQSSCKVSSLFELAFLVRLLRESINLNLDDNSRGNDVIKFLSGLADFFKSMLLPYSDMRKASLSERAAGYPFTERIKQEQTASYLTVCHLALALTACTSTPTIDFSTVYEGITAISRHIDENQTFFPSDVKTMARHVGDNYSLGAGNCMEKVWVTLFRATKPFKAEDAQSLDRLPHLLQDYQMPAADSTHMSMLPAELALELANMQQLTQFRDRLVEAPHHDEDRVEEKVFSRLTDFYSLITELGAIGDLPSFSDQGSIVRLEGLISVLKQRFALHPVRRVLAYQRLLRRKATANEYIGVLTISIKEWHRALWSAGTQDMGMEQLFGAARLKMAMSLNQYIRNGKLGEIQAGRESLDTLLSLMITESAYERTRRRELLAFILQTIAIIFIVSEPESRYDEIFRVMKAATAEAEDKKAVNFVSLLLKRSQHGEFSEIIEILDRFNMANTWADQVLQIGRICIELAKIFLSIFIPDIPVDPAAILEARERQRTRLVDWHEGQLSIHSRFELATYGRSSSVFTNQLQERLRQLEDIKVSYSTPAKRRLNCPPHRVQAFWKEVNAFHVDVVQSKRFQILYTASSEEGSDVTHLEALLQESTTNFLQRMKSAYIDVEDLVMPIELALINFRFGIGALRHANVLRSSTLKGSWRRLMLAFPSCRAKHALASVAKMNSGFESFPVAYTMLLKLLSETYGARRQNSNMQSIRNLLDGMYSLWKAVASKRTEELQASSSLYRSKQESEESEEEAVRFMFPTFDEENGNSTSTAPDATFSCRYSSEDLPDNLGLDILIAQEYYFSDGCQADSLRAVNRLWNRLKALLLTTFSDQDLALMPCSDDDESLAYRIWLLHSQSKELESEADEGSATVDFYRSPNLSEARRAADMIRRLESQLCILIHRWPEQLVLVHLKDRCTSISSMAMSSPVARLLSAFEQLLAHTEDWEMFADSANSLTHQRQDLINMIVHWRKMELASWRSILLSEQKEHCESLGEWWFKLYEATVMGTCSASFESTASIDEYLDSLTPLLSEFLSSSDRGQFGARLRMVLSFSKMTHQFAATEQGIISDGLRRTSFILSNIYGYYSQFEGRASALFKEEGEKLEREVEDLVKLATWKDVNVHALRQSAQRTHKQLFRRIRRYRELLRQPMSESFHDDEIRTHGEDCLHACEVPLEIFGSARQSRDGETRTKVLEKFLFEMNTARANIRKDIARQRVEQLSSEMAVAQKEYSALKPPQDLSATDRKRWASSLLTRKKRVWTDFLKEMQAAGFSTTVKADILQKNRSTRLLMDQISFPTQGVSVFSTLSQAESYFFHATGVLTQSIKSAALHNSDLTNRDAQRSLALLETAYNSAQTSRARAAKTMTDWLQLQRFLTRIRTLSTSQDIKITGHSALADIGSYEVRMRDLHSSLDEISQLRKRIGADSDGDVLFDDLMSCASEADRRSSVLILLSENLELSRVVSNDEISALKGCSELLQKTSELLRAQGGKEPRLHKMYDMIANHCCEGEELEFVMQQDGNSTRVPANDVTEFFLVVCQNIAALHGEKRKEDDTAYVRYQMSMIAQLSRSLRLDQALRKLENFMEGLHEFPVQVIHSQLIRILPFLDCYSRLVEVFLEEQLSWTRSLSKLAYVAGNILRAVLRDGFCRLPESMDDENESGKMEASDGTGFGRGEGTDNVSNQLEDESQFEGLKGEEDCSAKGDEGDDAHDIDFDLDGPLEDGSEGAESSLNEDDSDSHLDDTFENHDGDDNLVVNEDFWNKEDADEATLDPPEQISHEKTEQATGEVSAKDKDNITDDSDSKRQPSEPEDTENLNPEATEIEEANDESKMEDVENDSVIPTEELDQQDGTPDADDSEMSAENGNSEHDPMSDIECEDAGEMEGSDVGEGLTQEEGEEEPTKEHQADSTVLLNDQENGNGDAGVDSAVAESQQGDLAQGLNTAHNSQSQVSGLSTGEPIADQGTQSSLSRAVRRGFAENSQDDGANDLPMPQNPETALNEVTRRFDRIMKASENADFSPSSVEELKQQALEHAPSPPSPTDMHVLGPATTAERPRLDAIDIDEEDGHEQGEDTAEQQGIAEPQKASAGSADELLPTGKKRDKLGDDRHRSQPETDRQVSSSRQPQADDISFSGGSDKEDLNSCSVERIVTEWIGRGQSFEDGYRIWQLYDSLTQPLSFALCEQLRLILEPTKTTRLMGDFRTGKRLNMKKIIPYIASNYSKDKIWLRRVRPSQREYQVLITLDDSRSMAESHSIHLAFQTLALVSKALNKLEAGDVAIASFGREMKVLHSFDDGPFTDQEGTRVIEAFRFDQTSTDVRQMLEKSVEVLTAAREKRSTSSSSDLWQLEIIISDGICQNHEELRALIRQAAEERILVVFIILDGLSARPVAESNSNLTAVEKPDQNSILTMSQASYNIVDGKLELQTQRYLDSFPFEYFVILDKVERLPDVLSDTLRQFFEKISGS